LIGDGQEPDRVAVFEGYLPAQTRPYPDPAVETVETGRLMANWVRTAATRGAKPACAGWSSHEIARRRKVLAVPNWHFRSMA